MSELEEQLRIVSGQMNAKLAELSAKVKELKSPEGMNIDPLKDVVKLLTGQVEEINKFTKENLSKK